MIKFNKVFNSKVISLILAFVFLFTNITYGIDLSERSHLRKHLDFNNMSVAQRYLCALLVATYHNGLKQKLSPEQAFAKVMEEMGKRNAEELGIKVEPFEGGIRISHEKDDIDIVVYNNSPYGPKQEEHAVGPKVKRNGEAVVAQQVTVKIKPVIDPQKLMPTTAQKSAILLHPLAMIFWAFALKVGFVFTFGLITRDMEATTHLYWSLWYLNQDLLSISTYIFFVGWIILPLINTAPYILNKIGLLNSDYLRMAPIDRANAALAELRNKAENLPDKQIGREALHILSYVKGFYLTNFLNIFRGGGTDHLERIVRISTGELGVSSMVSANKAALKSLIYRRALILYLADSRNGFKIADVNDSAFTRWVKVNLHLRHRALDTWYMTFYYFIDQFYAGQFRIGKLFAHSNLQATPAISSNGQSIPEAIGKRVQARNIERVTSTSALIGKYELLTNPIFDEDSGTIRFTGKSIDTGRVEEITLNASRAPPEAIKRIKRIALLKTDNNAINKVLAWFNSSFSGQILLLEDNTQNIFGLGASGLIAINKSFSNNPIALLHEVAELAIDAGVITTEEIISSLQDRTWYDAHIVKDGRENLKPHYALRALQREVFGERDRELTQEIKQLQIPASGLVRELSEAIEQVLSEDEQIAKIILNAIGGDIENIRDPNKLCGWIASFTFGDRDVDPYKVLEIILEEFDQVQYLDVYKEVLGIKISKRQKMQQPPSLELIRRDWGIIDTTNMEELLGSLKPSHETQKIELEEVEMSPLGHGILSSHSPEELGDLKDAMAMVNKWVEEKRIMGEERISAPFTIHGIEILLDGKPVTMDVNNHSFIIKAFKDRVVIEAQGAYSVHSLFERVYIRSGFSGIAVLGGREFMFYYEGNKVILRPLHEILQIHRIIANNLTVNGALGIRRAEKGLYRADSGFRDLLTYSDPEDIPRLMNKYFKWLEKEEYRIQENSPEALHPVELAAQAFCKLLWIHPFENGNTRTAGLIMNYILMKNGFPPFMLNAANERRFYGLERFMAMPLKEDFSESEKRSCRIIDRDKIFSFTSYEYTAFLASQIALQMAPSALPSIVVEEELLDIIPSFPKRDTLSSSI